jgi:hypothetical protein
LIKLIGLSASERLAVTRNLKRFAGLLRGFFQSLNRASVRCVGIKGLAGRQG